MINLLFAGNYKVFDGILTCLLSIVKRAKNNEELCVYVFTMDITRVKPDYLSITNEQIEFLQSVLRSYNKKSKVIKIDVSENYSREFAYCPNEGAYCSPYTLLRLFADEFDNIPDKLLYLDADIMFNRDVRLLYDIDVSEVEYAAARDRYGKILVNPNYINAGVLLLNMKKIRETGLFVKARELIKTKKLPFADQSAIIRSTQKRIVLPQKFNDQKNLKKDTVVRHFSQRLFYFPYPHIENVKQWQVERVKKVFKYDVFNDVFDEYLLLKAQFDTKKENNEYEE